MTTHTLLNKNRIAPCCFLLAVMLSGCGKPATQPGPESSPAKSAAQASPTPSADDMEAGAAMLRILNVAHRNGGIMLRGECGLLGVTESYRIKTPLTLEPLDKACRRYRPRTKIFTGVNRRPAAYAWQTATSKPDFCG